jgi:hypothetical protein
MHFHHTPLPASKVVSNRFTVRAIARIQTNAPPAVKGMRRLS